jgi:phosphate/sulfate permease
MFKNKKGQLQLLLMGAIMMVVLAVVFGLGGKLMTDIGAGATAGSALANSTNYGGAAINDMSKYLPTIGAVLIIAVIIGLLLAYLYNRFVKSV